MESQQTALAAELDRRLAIIQSTEAGDESHRALTSSDLWISFTIVVVTVVIGLVVAL